MEVSVHKIELRSVVVGDGQIIAAFVATGPEASPSFIKDHVVMFAADVSQQTEQP